MISIGFHIRTPAVKLREGFDCRPGQERFQGRVVGSAPRTLTGAMPTAPEPAQPLPSPAPQGSPPPSTPSPRRRGASKSRSPPPSTAPDPAPSQVRRPPPLVARPATRSAPPSARRARPLQGSHASDCCSGLAPQRGCRGRCRVYGIDLGLPSTIAAGRAHSVQSVRVATHLRGPALDAKSVLANAGEALAHSFPCCPRGHIRPSPSCQLGSIGLRAMADSA